MTANTFADSALFDAVLTNATPATRDAASNIVAADIRHTCNELRTGQRTRLRCFDGGQQLRAVLRYAEATNDIAAIETIRGSTEPRTVGAATDVWTRLLQHPDAADAVIDHFHTLSEAARATWYLEVLGATGTNVSASVANTINTWLATVDITSLDKHGATPCGLRFSHIATKLASTQPRLDDPTRPFRRNSTSTQIATIIDRLISEHGDTTHPTPPWADNIVDLLCHKTRLTVDDLDWWLHVTGWDADGHPGGEHLLAVDTLDDDALDHLQHHHTTTTLTPAQHHAITIILLAAKRLNVNEHRHRQRTNIHTLLTAAHLVANSDTSDPDHLNTLVEHSLATIDEPPEPVISVAVLTHPQLQPHIRQELAGRAGHYTLVAAGEHLDEHHNSNVANDIVTGSVKHLKLAHLTRYDRYLNDTTFAAATYETVAATPGIISRLADNTTTHPEVVDRIAEQLAGGFADNPDHWQIANMLATGFPGTVDEFIRRVRALAGDR